MSAFRAAARRHRGELDRLDRLAARLAHTRTPATGPERVGIGAPRRSRQAARLTDQRGYGSGLPCRRRWSTPSWGGGIEPMRVRHAHHRPGFVRALLDVSFGNAAMIRGPRC